MEEKVWARNAWLNLLPIYKARTINQLHKIKWDLKIQYLIHFAIQILLPCLPISLHLKCPLFLIFSNLNNFTIQISKVKFQVIKICRSIVRFQLNKNNYQQQLITTPQDYKNNTNQHFRQQIKAETQLLKRLVTSHYFSNNLNIIQPHILDFNNKIHICIEML